MATTHKVVERNGSYYNVTLEATRVTDPVDITYEEFVRSYKMVNVLTEAADIVDSDKKQSLGSKIGAAIKGAISKAIKAIQAVLSKLETLIKTVVFTVKDAKYQHYAKKVKADYTKVGDVQVDMVTFGETVGYVHDARSGAKSLALFGGKPEANKKADYQKIANMKLSDIGTEKVAARDFVNVTGGKGVGALCNLQDTYKILIADQKALRKAVAALNSISNSVQDLADNSVVNAYLAANVAGARACLAVDTKAYKCQKAGIVKCAEALAKAGKKEEEAPKSKEEAQKEAAIFGELGDAAALESTAPEPTATDLFDFLND